MTSIPKSLRAQGNLAFVLDIARALGEFGQQPLETTLHTLGQIQLWVFSPCGQPHRARVFAVVTENGQLQSWTAEDRPLAEVLAHYRQPAHDTPSPGSGYRAVGTRRAAIVAAIAQHLPDDVRIVL